jgi:CheY-like chemotaxis protein
MTEQSTTSVDVLIVEDEEVVRSVMSRVLTSGGYTVTAVANGRDGLAALAGTTYGAVVCDIHMPVLDGVRFYQELRLVHREMQRRVLFVTAVAEAPDIRAFLEGTRCAVLQKPYELRQLVQAVATLVGRGPHPELLL